MVTLSLYAQPTDASPHLLRRALEEGEYEESARLFGVLPLTDIGARCVDVARSQFPDTELSLIETHGFGGVPWTILLQCGGLSVTMSLRPYRRAKGAEAWVLSLDLEGSETVLLNYLRRVVVKADHPPWQMGDPAAFEAKTGMSATTLRKRWRRWSTKERRLQRAVVAARLPDKVLLRTMAGLQGGGVRLKVVVSNQTAQVLKEVQLRVEGSGVPAAALERTTAVPRINSTGEATLLSDLPIDPMADQVRLTPIVTYEREGKHKRRTLEQVVLAAPLPELVPWRLKPSAWDGTTSGFVRERLPSVRRGQAAAEVLDEALQELQGLPMEALPPEVSKRSGAFRGAVRWAGTDDREGRFGLELVVSGGARDCRVELTALTSRAEDLPGMVRWVQRHERLGALLRAPTPDLSVSEPEPAKSDS